MKRYTSKSLEADLVGLNSRLEQIDHKYRFVYGSRYNYSAIDLATPENAARYCINSTLQTGTPRECLSACHAYICGLIGGVK